MTIEKFNGGYRISTVFYGNLVIQDYYYYSKKEAIMLFKQKLIKKAEKIEKLS